MVKFTEFLFEDSLRIPVLHALDHNFEQRSGPNMSHIIGNDHGSGLLKKTEICVRRLILLTFSSCSKIKIFNRNILYMDFILEEFRFHEVFF